MTSKKVRKFSQFIQRITVILVLSGGILLTAQPSRSQTVKQLFQQGNAAQKVGNYDEAERIWNQLLQSDPNNAEVYSNLGNALRLQGQLDQAIAAHQKAIELDPEYAEAYFSLIGALEGQGRDDEADAVVQKVNRILGFGREKE